MKYTVSCENLIWICIFIRSRRLNILQLTPVDFSNVFYFPDTQIYNTSLQHSTENEWKCKILSLIFLYNTYCQKIFSDFIFNSTSPPATNQQIFIVIGFSRLIEIVINRNFWIWFIPKNVYLCQWLYTV